MRKRSFSPGVDDVLEDRIVLSQAGVIGPIHVAVAHPKPVTPGHPVLRSGTLADVNHRIDLAFSQFGKVYKKDVAQLDKTHNESKFQGDLAGHTAKLRQTLDRLSTRLPGNNQDLTTALNARVDSLLHDLGSNGAQSSTDLIHSDQSGAHADVATYVHDEVAKGDFSLQ